MSVGHAYKLLGFFISYLTFLTFPCLFCTYQLCFFFPTSFPPFSPFPLPADNPPNDLHTYDSVPLLVVWLVCFWFLDSVVDSCEFVVIVMFIVLIFFSYISLSSISYSKGLVMMNSFSFFFVWEDLYLPFNSKWYFCWVEQSWLYVPVFMTLNISCQSLLACKVSFEKSADSLMRTPCR